MRRVIRFFIDSFDRFRNAPSSKLAKWLVVLLGVYLSIVILLGFVWSWTPSLFDVKEHTEADANNRGAPIVVGSYTTSTLIHLTDSLLDKPGGYLSNDRFPPGVIMDNVPNWEFGVLVQIRDLSRAMRKTFSRSQSQSTEQKELSQAEPKLHFDNNSWLIPSSESEYEDALRLLAVYQSKLTLQEESQAQFFARADNLQDWLGDVSTRLGSISQRLSASVGQRRINTNLAGSDAAAQATSQPAEIYIQTPWSEIDDVFYEARGTAWALIHILKAIELDFAQSLDRKNAITSFRQVVRELEATQSTIYSPIILNGTEFGLLSNHSLVMASYISRANAAIIDLRDLLAQG